MSTLVAVLTRSAVVSILVTLAAASLLWLNGWTHSKIESARTAMSEVEEKIRKSTVTPKADATAKGKEKDKEKDAGEEDEERTRKPWEFPRWVTTTSDVLYRVLPRTRELNALTSDWVARGILTESQIKEYKLDKAEKPRWGEVVGVTGAFIALMLGLACWRFARADY